ncbi:hypothetical protein HanXRQr2_Chr03g0110131 [Helianthus annuus]|uniref:Uncharacterized protein n=1 Tax=Helianthus annuus TaxID=4232 RepID=A0A9K3NVX2_HELAN|nr:hypothetical protein HanXRQr2_Chr03g0110131 [Helianthus annuus]KAJ0943600.1 hypothetical protein HanPSC8_Chr03g0106651 [Helianthus annuus]
MTNQLKSNLLFLQILHRLIFKVSNPNPPSITTIRSPHYPPSITTPINYNSPRIHFIHTPTRRTRPRNITHTNRRALRRRIRPHHPLRRATTRQRKLYAIKQRSNQLIRISCSNGREILTHRTQKSPRNPQIPKPIINSSIHYLSHNPSHFRFKLRIKHTRFTYISKQFGIKRSNRRGTERIRPERLVK